MIMISKTADGTVVNAVGDSDTILWELATATAQIHLKLLKDKSPEGIKAMADEHAELLCHLMILMNSPRGKEHIKDMSFSMSEKLGKGVN